MTGKKLALFFLLILALELMLPSTVDCWRRRRRRRRRAATPPPTTPPPTTPKPTPPPCDSSVPPNITWANKWHESFAVHCPFGYSVRQWASLFRACKQDRIHLFRCRASPAANSHSNWQFCDWTPTAPRFLHEVKEPFFYKCPYNGFITGVKSYYDGASKDRKITLKCCHGDNYSLDNCHTTWGNNFNQTLNLEVPISYAMTGVGSVHSGATSVPSDRRWMFETCRVTSNPRTGKK